MNKFKIWLDDERNPKEKIIQDNFGANGDEIWIKTAEALIVLIKQNIVESVSFDHDLGENNISINKNGYDVALLIEELAYNNEIDPISWKIHTQNPVGRKNIENAMKNADRYWKKYFGK